MDRVILLFMHGRSVLMMGSAVSGRVRSAREVPGLMTANGDGQSASTLLSLSDPHAGTRCKLTSPECRQLHSIQIQQRSFFRRIAIGCAGYYNRYSQLRLVQAAPERIGHHDALKSPRQRV